MADNMLVGGENPIIPMDFPDPDILRVGDTYYMVSTTMYFMPGCVILRSHDLIRWEYCARVYDALEDTPAQRLECGANAYGKGMWAASLRRRGDTFYISFIAHDTGKTYLFHAKDMRGPWTKGTIEGFYYDSALFFDDDGRAYIVHGNAQIRITELADDLSGPKPGGLNRIIADSGASDYLGYEGAHFYKIGGRYYLFVIHSRKDRWKRVESCLSSDSLTGEFTGGVVFDDDLGFFDQGAAQGGVIDTPDGRWLCYLFQDRGAAGRMPVLIPMTWKDGMPVIGENGKAPRTVQNRCERADWTPAPLYGSDDFTGEMKPFWEWNHTPDRALCSYGGGRYAMRFGKTCGSITQAVNTLTQRTLYPGCFAAVTLCGADLRNGDTAGLCALQDRWAFAGLTRENGRLYVTLRAKNESDPDEGVEIARMPAPDARVRLGVRFDFENMKDEAAFYIWQDGAWRALGAGYRHRMVYLLSHFTGYRIALFGFAEREAGGGAAFSDFTYEADMPKTAG